MPAVEMVFMWNNLLEAKMDAHMSKTDSKMDLDVNLLRLQRRIKVASQHKFMGDTRSGSFNVAWDADKDSSKQVGFDGSFTLSATQRLIDLKCVLIPCCLKNCVIKRDNICHVFDCFAIAGRP